MSTFSFSSLIHCLHKAGSGRTMEFGRYLSILKDVAQGSKEEDEEHAKFGRDAAVDNSDAEGQEGRNKKRESARPNHRLKVDSFIHSSHRHKSRQVHFGVAQDDALPRKESSRLTSHDGSPPRNETKSDRRDVSKSRRKESVTRKLKNDRDIVDRATHRSQSEARHKRRALQIREISLAPENKSRPSQPQRQQTIHKPMDAALMCNIFPDQVEDGLAECPPEEWTCTNPTSLTPFAPNKPVRANPSLLISYKDPGSKRSERDFDEASKVEGRVQSSRKKSTKPDQRSPERKRSGRSKYELRHTDGSILETLSKEKLKRDLKKKRKQEHVRWFGHGRFSTISALVMTWTGAIFSILALRSTEFVRLQKPLAVAPIYNDVYATGMVRLEICYNETVAAPLYGCEVITLDSDDVSDNMFQIARLFLTLSAVFGSFFTIVMTSSVYWQSINLRPVGFGYLATYFLQSFAMLFFDTEICATNKCNVGSGCIFCIFACISWIGACASTAKMDVFKAKSLRRRRRERRAIRRRQREERMREEIIRKEFDSTTARTDSTTSSNSSQDGDPEIGVANGNDQLYDC